MEKSIEVNCRPHTPRRFGTSHYPTAESVKGLVQQHEAAVGDDAFKAPQYWDECGKNFKLRPNSAPTRRSAPIPTPTIDQLLDSGVAGLGGRSSAIDFRKQLPRPPLSYTSSTTSPRDPSKAAAAASVELITRADALDRAAPQISPRLRGFSMSAALARSTQPISSVYASYAQPVCSPTPATITNPKGFVSFKKVPTREQAQYAAGMGPPPTVCEYRTRLPKHAAAQCRTAEEEEYYLEVFVDEQDNQFTAGIAAESRQRAKIVTRKRNMPSSGDSSHRGGKKDADALLTSPRSTEPRGVNFGRMSGRDGVGEHKLMRKLLQQHRESASDAFDIDESSHAAPNHIAHPPSTPVVPRPSARCGVTMAKTTGRTAPVSTTMPQPERGTSGCDAIYANATTYRTIGSSRVPTIDLSKLAARSDRPVDRTKDQCDSARLSYRVVDSQIVRRFPAAIM